MSQRKCADCGQFCARLNDVWSLMPQLGVDREVCDDCLPVWPAAKEEAVIPTYPNCATCDGGGCGDCA